MPRDLPTFADVAAAAQLLAGVALRTPVLTSPALVAVCGARVLLKAECLQHTGSFKFRGAYNRIAQVDRARYPGGVVACSSGNHAQGVAAAAALLGHAAAIVMPADAPSIKLARTRGYGAKVVPYDRDSEDREAIARDLASRLQADFVHPFDDAAVIAGQGTIGLELAEAANTAAVELDEVLVPCSGGGLASGIALAMKHARPALRITIVEPRGFDDFARSLSSGVRQSNARTSGSLADALMAATPGQLTFAIGQKLFSDAVTVSDDELAEAVRFAFTELKLVVEPGGAAALAALLAGKIAAKGRNIGVVLSGGNVDAQTFARIVTRQ